MSFLQHDHHGVIFHTAENLSALPGIVHGFSTRLGGVSTEHLAQLNLRGSEASGDNPQHIQENYRRFCEAVGLSFERVVLSKQVHETTVRLVTEEDAGKGLHCPRDYTADALITDQPQLPLFVFSADCIVILLCEPHVGCIGAVHAGWRGTAGQILRKTVAAMVDTFGAEAANIQAAIGAGIGQCCFETRDDVPQAMLAAMGEEARPFLQPSGEKWMVDLKGINRRQLELAGVPTEQIQVSPLCTACHPELYWSHRKMGDQRGVQAAAIMLKKGTP